MHFKSISILAIAVSFSLSSKAITTSFEGGTPSGWNASSQWRTASFEGKTYLCTNIATANKDVEGLVKSTDNVSPEELPSCNNVIAEVVLSNLGPMNENIDMFQVVVSTNANWSAEDIIPIGEPFKYYDAGSEGKWATHKVFATIDGLSGCTEFYFGLKVIAAGWSMNSIYVKSISVDFLAGAKCTFVGFNEIPQIGDENVLVTATVNKEPEEAISGLTVLAEVCRNGFVYTNQMHEAAIGSYTNDVLRVDTSNVGSMEMPPIDAGDDLNVRILTRYASSIPAMGDLDESTSIYTEKSDSTLEFLAPQLGSVWINEFSLNSVELCGTTNRYYSPGWSLELVDSNSVVVARKEFVDAFDFSAMPNKMIGLETYSLGWSIDALVNPCSLVLKNAAGVVEHREDGLTITGPGDVFGMTGVAHWPAEGYAYDWSGTAFDGTFTWTTFGNSSFGELNEGQFFEIESFGWFKAKTVVPMGEDPAEPFEFANVSYEIDWSSGPANGVEQTDANGQTPTVAFSGSHTNYEHVVGEFGVSAFGWQAESRKCPLSFGMTNDNVIIELSPTVAKDDFSSGKLNSYWSNVGTRNFYYQQLGDNGFARFDSRTANHGTDYAAIKSKNYLKSRGSACLAMSFSVRNDLSLGLDGTSDYAYIQVATNDSFLAEHIVAQSMSISNRIAGIATGTWNSGMTVVKLPDYIDGTTPVYPRVIGEAGGWSMLYLDVDDIRIAFQNMATISDVRLTGTETSPGFEIDVEPWCAEGQSVSNVTVQLVMDVDGKVFTNDAVCASGAVTNLDAATTFTVAPDVIAENLERTVGYATLRTNDAVKYWAQVNYYADSRDLDPEKEWETRYFPDNATVDDDGRWTVAGVYGVDAAKVASNYSYVMSGDPITLNSDFALSASDVSAADFSFRSFNPAGVSSVSVSACAVGAEDPAFATNLVAEGVSWYDAEVSMDGLTGNTDYVLTIVSTPVGSGVQTSATFSFTTLPEAPTAAIEEVTTSTAKLTVSGNAAGYVVPAGWVQEGATSWLKSGLTPNTEISADGIYATNKVGAASGTIDATHAYTLAAAATQAPVIDKAVTTVTVGAGQDYDAADDGNPATTEYAICVTTSNNSEPVYVSDNSGPVWKTLEAWRTDEAVVLDDTVLDLEATNYFSFVTRNEDEVETVSEVKSSCTFDMTADFAAGGPAQRPAASRNDTDFGVIDFGLELSDPAQSAEATVTVEYKIGEGAWTQLAQEVIEFTAIDHSIGGLEWDAWTAVGETDGEYAYRLRAKVAAGGRESAWAEVSGTLDFAPPTGLTIAGTPANGAVVASPAYDLSLAATDPNGVTYAWTLDGDAGTGATIAGSGSSVQNGVTHTLEAVATDGKGNTCAAANWSWTVDTVAPAGLAFTAGPAEGSFATTTAFEFTAAATDATDLVYHWTLNGVAAVATTATYAGTAVEGSNTVTVYAEDAAGNVCAAVSRNWTLDTTNPTNPVIAGTPAELTKVAAFSLTASSEDANAITFHWQFGAAEWVEFASGVAFAGTATEGDNTVRVYAQDAAGNTSGTVGITWTLDTTAPTELAISGTPAAGVITADNAVNLSASANDAHDITYTWTLNGAQSTGETLVGTAQEGANTVSVVAEDAAGNVSEPVVRTWTLDTTDPTDPVITGAPEGLTKVAAFSLTAASSDANAITFNWRLGDAEWVELEPGVAFTGTAAEGANKVQVYAEDAAGNTSETVEITWTLDTTAPTGLAISGTPEAGAITADNEVNLSASATDAHDITYTWTFNGAQSTGDELVGTAQEGLNTVSVVAEDAAGNVCAAVSRTWTLDITKPANLAITGTPANNAITQGKTINLTAGATDATTLTYHWTFGESTEVVTNYIGEVEYDGGYTISVYARDAAGNESDPVVLTWTVDNTPPTDPEITGAPASLTNVPAFSLTASSEDANAITFHWQFGAAEWVELASGVAFAGTAAEGANTVRVYAEDAAGNTSGTVVITWTLDTTAPTGLAISGTPEAGAITADNAVNLSASANDAHDITYTWTFKGIQSTGATLEGTAQEGLNTVVVVARDAVGNESAPVVRIWTLDATPPTDPEITGAPASLTNVPAFSLTASSEDANAITFHWQFGAAEWVELEPGVAFAGTATEGDNTVRVYAQDAAGNKSGTVEITWTLDTTAPTGLAISGTPEVGAITANNAVNLSASANDAHDITYTWTLNGAQSTGATLVGTAQEGANTVSVVARDAAGNVCAAVSRTWTLDTIDPTDPVITGAPEGLTKVAAFSLTAASSDANAITFNWRLGDAEWVELEPGVAFTGTAAEGANKVQVYAEDAAGNTSETVEITWTLDTTAPTGLAISGTPAAGAITADNEVNLSASANDAHDITYTWTFNGAQSTGDELVGTAQEGLNTVSVVAEDAAGNVCAAVSRTWTLDITKPANLAITGTPANNAITQGKTINLTAGATDATTLTYHWTFGESTVAVTNYTNEVEDDGDYTISVYARDAAGNESDPVVLTWTVDNTPPTDPEITGTPDPDELTKETAFNFTASSEDDNDLTYHWRLGDAEWVELASGVAFAGTATEGANTVQVYAEDAAGNTSGTVEITWTLDTTAPTGLAISGTPEVGAITANNAVNLSASANDAHDITYTWTLNGAQSTGATLVGTAQEGPNTVSVVAEDAAGNVCAAVSRTWTVDTTGPDQPVISGTPANGSTTNVSGFSLTASTTDPSGIWLYIWIVNGDTLNPVMIEGDNTYEGESVAGLNTIHVLAMDNLGNSSLTSDTWSWTYEELVNVDFGGTISLPIDPVTGETNSVAFTAVDFRPGEASSFTMSGFEAANEEISGLQMWLVTRESLDGADQYKAVDVTATYDTDTKELTVTLPATATEDMETLFVLGVDNENKQEE